MIGRSYRVACATKSHRLGAKRGSRNEVGSTTPFLPPFRLPVAHLLLRHGFLLGRRVGFGCTRGGRLVVTGTAETEGGDGEAAHEDPTKSMLRMVHGLVASPESKV